MDKKAKIKKRWEEKAKIFGTKPQAVIRDIEFRKLSNSTVASYLDKKDYVLDIGCGNGYATTYYSNYCRKILGVDYLPKFIELSKLKYKKHIKNGKLEFQIGDILKPGFPNGIFDKIICERTIINLTSWQNQQKALSNLSKLLKKNGLLLLTEISIQGHKSLDDIRKKVGLPIVEKYWSNLYLDEPKFERFIKKLFKIQEKKRFGTYMLVSKIIHPMLVYPREPKFEAKINKIAAQVAKIIPWEDGPSHVVFYVLKKNA